MLLLLNKVLICPSERVSGLLWSSIRRMMDEWITD
jgi:hypothetical protein